MRVLVGTSGYSYKEWKGKFYPEDLPPSKMLPFYATHFESVEVNNTFYRMPNEKLMTKWASEVPEGFRFALKAPRWLTHARKLDAPDDVRRFFDIASLLGPKLGPARFLLPPFVLKDVSRLREFLNIVPKGNRVCLDFRHESWMDEEVFAALREHDAALCTADTDDVPDPDKILVSTASWGYLRLRRAEYSDEQLSAWVRHVTAQRWSDAYLFFRHEDEGTGPIFAKRLQQCLH
jgi:uncharacterized protein YecE (DUF72 family)